MVDGSEPQSTNSSYMFGLTSYRFLSAAILGFVSSIAQANLSDAWYVGGGYASSQLFPRAEDNSVSRLEEVGTGATFFVGRDFDDRSSGQLQLYSLGDVVFDDTTIASYNAADASFLYRFYDSRDNRGDRVFGTSVYGRFGLGFLDRDTEVILSTNSAGNVYFGLAAGLETYLTRTFALRAELIYHDSDAVSGNISLVTRFGQSLGSGIQYLPANDPNRPPSLPTRTQNELPRTVTPAATSIPQAIPLPSTGIDYRVGNEVSRNGEPRVPNGSPSDRSKQLPEVAVMTRTPPSEYRDSLNSENIYQQQNYQSPLPSSTARTDSDRDGVFDEVDSCLGSALNSTVDATGCSPFARIAQKIQFVDNSTLPLSSVVPALNELAAIMMRNVNLRIELAAHSDNLGNAQQKSSLTRQRLRAIGIYLVQRGISQDRLVLRSYGSKRPVFDNNSEAGRRANNRIEITEQP